MRDPGAMLFNELYVSGVLFRGMGHLGKLEICFGWGTWGGASAPRSPPWLRRCNELIIMTGMSAIRFDSQISFSSFGYSFIFYRNGCERLECGQVEVDY